MALLDLFNDANSKKMANLLSPFSPSINTEIPVSVNAPTNTYTSTSSQQYTDSRVYAPSSNMQYSVILNSPNASQSASQSNPLSLTNRTQPYLSQPVSVTPTGATVPVTPSVALPNLSGGLFGLSLGTIAIVAAVGIGGYLLLKKK